MMVAVTGGKAWQREMASSIGCYMMKQLLPRIRTCDVQIRFKDLASEGVDGYCHELSNRVFLIEVDKNLKMMDFVKTLCHEFVHVKQYVKREMVDYFDRKTISRKIRWKKTVYGYGTAYDRMPWEKEAFRLQEIYTQKVFDEGII